MHVQTVIAPFSQSSVAVVNFFVHPFSTLHTSALKQPIPLEQRAHVELLLMKSTACSDFTQAH